MKKKLSVLSVLLITMITFAHAQSKKDIEDELIKCTKSKDSIQNMYSGLSATYDSINKVCMVYDSMYSAIKEKVFKQDFDPAKISVLIDSLQLRSFSVTGALSDSISVLQQENVELEAKIESLSAETHDNTELVNNLKQLKELLDEGIISQEEYDAKKAVLIEKL